MSYETQSDRLKNYAREESKKLSNALFEMQNVDGWDDYNDKFKEKIMEALQLSLKIKQLIN